MIIRKKDIIVFIKVFIILLIFAYVLPIIAKYIIINFLNHNNAIPRGNFILVNGRSSSEKSILNIIIKLLHI